MKMAIAHLTQKISMAIKHVPYAPDKLTQNHAKHWAQTAENDAMPLQFDFHPHNGEGGRGHTLKQTKIHN